METWEDDLRRKMPGKTRTEIRVGNQRWRLGHRCRCDPPGISGKIDEQRKEREVDDETRALSESRRGSEHMPDRTILHNGSYY